MIVTGNLGRPALKSRREKRGGGACTGFSIGISMLDFFVQIVYLPKNIPQFTEDSNLLRTTAPEGGVLPGFNGRLDADQSAVSEVVRVAGLTLDKHILAEVVKRTSEAGLPAGTGWLDSRAVPSECAPCLSVGAFLAGSLLPRSRAQDQALLRMHIGEFAGARPRRFGYRRFHTLLRREGWQMKKKRGVHRPYRLGTFSCARA